MTKGINQIVKNKNILYSNILLLSRNKIFYTKFNLIDNFQNRIHLIFIHISFIFIKIKEDNKNNIYKTFYQEIFDLIFKKIEQNMREIGFGDVTVNKNMKFLVKIFYNILLNVENYKNMSIKNKAIFFGKHLSQNQQNISSQNNDIIKYFNQYDAFCFDLSSDSVLKGELKFKYK